MLYQNAELQAPNQYCSKQDPGQIHIIKKEICSQFGHQINPCIKGNLGTRLSFVIGQENNTLNVQGIDIKDGKSYCGAQRYSSKEKTYTVIKEQTC